MLALHVGVTETSLGVRNRLMSFTLGFGILPMGTGDLSPHPIDAAPASGKSLRSMQGLPPDRRNGEERGWSSPKWRDRTSVEPILVITFQTPTRILGSTGIERHSANT